MSSKLLWTGVTLILAAELLPIPVVKIVGEVILVLGCILMWLDR